VVVPQGAEGGTLPCGTAQKDQVLWLLLRKRGDDVCEAVVDTP